MPDSKTRLRVERLLRGEFRPDDLTAIFLFARDHCDGRETLTDIGAFVAHHHQRDRGITTRLTREWAAVVRFQIPRFLPGATALSPLNSTEMPAASRDFFKIAIGRLDAAIVKRETGLSVSRAKEIMRGVVDGMVTNPNGTWALSPNLSQKEMDVVRCACSFIVARPAFADTRLFDDFVAMLKSNGLVTKEEQSDGRVEALRVPVYLYAAVAMHNCEILLEDGSAIVLKGRADLDGNSISVDAAVPTGKGARVTTAMFSAGVDPRRFCHPELLAQPWDFEIEVTPDGRITRLK